MEPLHPTTQVACLLCGHLSKGSAPLLTQGEFASLYQWLVEQGVALEALLEPQGVYPLLEEIEQQVGLSADRLQSLLQRGVQLAMWLERWLNAGMWVLSWDDAGYPRILRERLGEQAPVLLHGFGNADLLHLGGLAIVGSREASESLLDVTRYIANRCAQEGWNVVSGGARGVDRASMTGALEEGGTCVAVLAADLARVATLAPLRDPLLMGKLCLVSPYHPESGFSVGNAMGRNKVIYALADYALVIACQHRKGGTWAGAQEALKKGWVSVFVYAGDEAPADNAALIKEGALPFVPATYQSLRQQMEEAEASARTQQIASTSPMSNTEQAKPGQLTLSL